MVRDRDKTWREGSHHDLDTTNTFFPLIADAVLIFVVVNITTNGGRACFRKVVINPAHAAQRNFNI